MARGRRRHATCSARARACRRSPCAACSATGTAACGSAPRAGSPRLHDGRIDTLTAPDGLPDNVVIALHEDREGGLWFGTYSGGLGRIKDSAFIGYGAQGRASPTTSFARCSRRATAAIWIGTHGAGLTRVRERRLHDLHDARRPAERHGDGLCRVARRQPLDRHQRRALALPRRALPRTGRPRDGLPHDSVRALLEDRDGTLWVGMRGGGLARFRDGRFTRADGRGRRRRLGGARAARGARRHDVGRHATSGSSHLGAAAAPAPTRRATGSSLDVVYAIHEDARRRAVDWHLRRRHQPLQERPLHPLHDQERPVRRHRLSGARGSRGLALDHVQQGADARQQARARRGGGRQGRDRLHTDGLRRARRPARVGVQRQLAACRLGRARRPAVVSVDQGRHRRRPVGAAAQSRCRRRSCSSRCASTGRSLRRSRLVTAGPGSGELEFRYAALSFTAPAKDPLPVSARRLRRRLARRRRSTRRLLHQHSAGPYTFRVVAANADGVWSPAGGDRRDRRCGRTSIRPPGSICSRCSSSALVARGAGFAAARRRVPGARARAHRARRRADAGSCASRSAERLQAEASARASEVALSRALRRCADRVSRARHGRPAASA